MANQITPALLDLLRVDINAALKAVGEKHGVVLKLANASYSATNATWKLNVNTIGDGGTVVTKEMSDLKRYAPLHSLTEAHLTQEFNVGPEKFVLVGYRSKAPVKPFLAKNLRDGKQYILTEAQVHHGLGINKPAPSPLVITRLPHIPTGR